MDKLRSQDPSHIGAYRLIARLGAGGMGEVFLGRSPGGRLVAVKVIREEISDHPEALARFRREAATVETVRSAYTAQLIEASLDTAPYWLATEYVEGPTLRGAVGEEGPFPAESALRLLAALAEGLAAVHVHGVTHRDLKPHNVVLSPQGPQLIDFGIARGLEQTVLTRDGMAPGTPGYAAPEVVLRNEVGPAADLFALGATLAYAATGRPPFGTGDATAVSYRAVHEDIDLAGVEPRLAALIRWCVAKDPAERPDPADVIAACAVDTALAQDAHYRTLTRRTEPMAVTGRLPEPDAATAATKRATKRAAGEPADGDVAPHAAALSANPPAATPYAQPGRRQNAAAASAAARRRAAWLGACAVVLAASATVWVIANPDGRGSRAASGAGGSHPTATAADGRSPAAGAPPAKTGRVPDHILNDRVSQDRWALSEDPGEAGYGMGSCDVAALADASPPSGLRSSVSHSTGSDTATVVLRPEKAGQGERPAPYYVSVGIRPPHETDRTTGKPTRAPSKGIGFTSKPVDLYSRWSAGGTLTLRYPDDFRAHFGERTQDALPVGEDRGDWTVVLYHVEGGPTAYTSVSCNGFHA